jgi:hypothetical protein
MFDGELHQFSGGVHAERFHHAVAIRPRPMREASCAAD